ncbi:unnamed protein product [Arctia plantaginis]|uniref:Uncharacterized protein n=1 Tax=Arctia plantaginis TaxID=874455 RepID=A0A8S0ZHC8_ARCPL|nr:unnamed protein product [Arctia plantaginis]CAB3232308.1 unnamed protein product [Arctia plantaginis]
MTQPLFKDDLLVNMVPEEVLRSLEDKSVSNRNILDMEIETPSTSKDILQSPASILIRLCCNKIPTHHFTSQQFLRKQDFHFKINLRKYSKTIWTPANVPKNGPSSSDLLNLQEKTKSYCFKRTKKIFKKETSTRELLVLVCLTTLRYLEAFIIYVRGHQAVINGHQAYGSIVDYLTTPRTLHGCNSQTPPVRSGPLWSHKLARNDECGHSRHTLMHP